MHCHSHGAQITDTHHAADDISTEVIKYQDFPDRVAVGVEDWRNWSEEAIGLSFIGVVRFDRLVQVQDLPERSYLPGYNGPFDAINCTYTYLFGDPLKSFLWSP